MLPAPIIAAVVLLPVAAGEAEGLELLLELHAVPASRSMSPIAEPTMSPDARFLSTASPSVRRALPPDAPAAALTLSWTGCMLVLQSRTETPFPRVVRTDRRAGSRHRSYLG